MRLIFQFLILGAFLSSCENRNNRYPIIDPLQSTAIQKKPDSTSAIVADSGKIPVVTPIVKPPVPSKSLLDNVSLSMDHTLFIAALQSTGLDNLLSGKKIYTVFAPTDEAFKKLPHGGVNTMLKASNKDMLHQMLLNHIVASNFTSATLKDGSSLKTLGGKVLKVDNKDGRIMVNGVNIRSGEVACSNGTLFIADGILTN